MADKYINETGLQTIKTWANGKFAKDADLDTLSDRVDDIVAEGGEPNTIESISVNGTTVTPDANKNVALTTPTSTSDLTNDGDGTSNFATEAYVATNGGKIDKIKVNGTEQTIDTADKSVNVTVPTKVSDLQNDGDGTSGSAFATEDYVDTNGGKIDKIKVNGAEQTISAQDKSVNITVPTNLSQLQNDGDGTQGSTFATNADVETAINTAVASAYKYKGSVATVADLPASGNTKGDVYDVQSNGMNYAWNGTAWDALGQIVDTSLLWAKSELVAMTVAEINAILAD